MRRGEVSSSHRVMMHFITAFFWLQLLWHYQPHAWWKQISVKKNCNTAVFKQKPQTFPHSKHFVAKCLCVQILDQLCFWWKKTYKFGLAVCCCLHFALVFNSFIIKGFSVSAPCWTRSCNRRIKNWDLWIVLIISHTHEHTYTHTYCCAECRHMNAGGHAQYVLYMHWKPFLEPDT